MKSQTPLPEEPIKQKNTLLAKIVIGIILLAFIFTGIQSYLTSPTSSPVVAQIDDVKIYQQTLQQQLQQTLKTANDPSLINFILSENFVNQVLENLIHQALIQKEVHSLKLVIPDELLKSFIRHTPDLDPVRLKDYLQRTGQSEKALMQTLRTNLSNEQLSSALFSGLTLPKVLQQAFEKAESTLRSVKILSYPNKTRKISVPTPTPDQVSTYFSEHTNDFLQPEKRTIVMLKITPQPVTVEEAEAKAYFNDNAAQYQSPETRDVAVLTLKDEETYNPNDQDGYKDRFISLGLISPEMIEADLAQQIFHLPESSYSDPIPTSEGRKIYWVKKINPAQQLSFEHVKNQIMERLKTQKQSETTKSLIQKIDDAIGGGESFEEISQAYPGVSLETYAGLTEKDMAQKLDESIAQEAFRQKVGDDGQIQTTQQGLTYSIKVTSIKPAHVPELEKIQSQVQAAYITFHQRELARELAQKITNQINQNGFDSSLFVSETIKDHTLSNLNAKLNLDQKSLLALAALKAGKALYVPTQEGGNVLYVSTVHAPIAPDKQTQTALDSLLVRLVTQTYQRAYFEALKNKHRVKINQKLVEDTLEKLRETYQD